MKRLITIIPILFCLSIYSENPPEEILHNIKLDEKLGQLFIAAIPSTPTKKQIDKINFLITRYKIGGILFHGLGNPLTQAKLTNDFQSLSKIPLFISQDLECGLSMRLEDTIRFPKNMTLGSIQNNESIYELGREIGKQCKRIGVNINLAPVIDINNNPENPIIGYRSFGEDPVNVALKGISFMQGLQDEQIIACAKHFPGHGDTNVDSHLDLPVIPHSLERLNSIELKPFIELINHGVKSIMIAHLLIPKLDNLPSSLSYNVTTKLLKDELNFHGLIITDALNMKGITKQYKPGISDYMALLAGNDILLYSKNIPLAIETIKNGINNNEISEEEINSKVLKILKIKELINTKPVEIKNIFDDLNNTNALLLKKRLYEEAITLVKNEYPLPIVDKTISFIQLGSNKKTIFEKELQKSIDIKEYNPENNLPIVIGLFGMNRNFKQNFGISKETLDLIEKIKNKNKILVIFGSPYSLKFFEKEKTILVSYEEEAEAQIASANIISGKLTPRGILPISIN